MENVEVAAPPVAEDWRYEDQEKERVDVCEVCGTGSPRLVSAVDRYQHAARFVLCKRCGLVWNTPRLTADGYSRFYRDGIYRRISGDYCQKNGGGTGTGDKMRDYYRGMLSHVYREELSKAEGWTLLDVGGADGLVAAELKERWKLGDTAVLEPHEDEASEVPDGITTYVGGIEDLDLPKAFDIVCCFQTIEHIQNPRAALLKMRTLTRKLLLIDCVHFPVMWNALKHLSCKIDHPMNFHYEALRCLLYQVGFRPVDMTFRKDKPAAFIAAVPAEPVSKLPGPAFVHEVLGMFK